jgi:hypothetical protein
MVRVAMREPQSLVPRVRSRTVAKVDSMGLVVRRCDLAYLSQAFSQPTGPGRLWISLAAAK